MGRFIQNQVLGMAWLNGLVGRFVDLIGLDVRSPIGGSLQFFLYDTVKITVLLFF